MSLLYTDSAPDSEHAAFSLRDEIRNTNKHHSDWAAAEVKLRHSRVTFVSAAGNESEDIDVARNEQVKYSHSTGQRYTIALRGRRKADS